MTEQTLNDAILRHSLQLLRLSAGDQARVTQTLDELARELRALVASADLADATKRDIEALAKQAEEAITASYAQASATVDTEGLVRHVAEKTQELIEEVLPISVKLPTDAMLMQLGKDVLIDGAPSSAWWARQSEDLAFRFAAQVRQGVVNGETQEQIVARITGRRTEPGIMDLARRNARSLVHSSVMTAANRARLETFRRNGKYIAGVRWMATLDGHTCPRCAALDGQAWNLDGEKLPGTKVEFMAPPIHFGDRCILTPVPRRSALEQAFPGISAEFDAVSERASSQGPLPGKTTFQDFLKRQSPEFVAATLGKKRAELFLAGKLTVRDLISGTGRELTLDELRTH